MSTRAHLQKIAGHITRTADHHLQKSEYHARMAEHFQSVASMGKAHDDGLAKLAEAVAAEHSGMSEEHTQMADDCAKCAKSIFDAFKAEEPDELQKARGNLMPTEVSAVAPTAPGLTMVPRAGQRIESGVRVPKEFAHLTKIETGEDDVA